MFVVPTRTEYSTAAAELNYFTISQLLPNQSGLCYFQAGNGKNNTMKLLLMKSLSKLEILGTFNSFLQNISKKMGVLFKYQAHCFVFKTIKYMPRLQSSIFG